MRTIRLLASTAAALAASLVLTATAVDANGSSTWTFDGPTPFAPGFYTAGARESDAASDSGLVPKISIGDVTVTEGDSGTVNAHFAVVLDQAPLLPVTVQYATANGTATQPADFSAASGTVTFGALDMSETITVAVKGDTLDEIDEAFTVNLSNPTNASIADGSGTGTITNDDGPTAVSVGDATVTEGDAGTVNATFTVTLSAVSGRTVTVDYATANGTATQPSDYTSASGTVTFNAGQTSKTIDVTVKGDTLDEIDEAFTVGLSNPTNASIADASGTGTISNDDGPPTVSIDDASVTEGDAGTTNATFTVTLSAASGKTVTVDYATANGTATQPADYAPASGTVTFAPLDVSETITVAVRRDTLDEPDETFTLGLSNPSNVTVDDGTGVGTISDDDPPPTVSVADASVTEGDAGTTNATFTVTLSAASGKTVTVDYATADGTATQPADYVSATDTLTFTPGQTSKQVSVTVNGDTVNEVDETVLVDLTAPTNASIGDAQGVGTILDDDFPALAIGDAMVTEPNAGTVNATFSVALSSPSAQTVTVHWATADGSATAPADYAASSGDLTFTPGATTRTLDVPVKGDLLDEDIETFAVVLSAPSKATLGDGGGTGTITDNDGPPSVSISDQTITEGNSGTTSAGFTVSLSAASGKPVTVQAATADGSATEPSDYTPASGAVQIAPGQTSATFSVAVNGDGAVEPDETFTAELSAPVNATLTDATATGTIVNDDAPTPPIVPRISVDSAAVDEGDSGIRPAAFTVSLSPAPTAPVTVKFATADVTATAPADYVPVVNGTLTFNPGQTSKAIIIAVVGDTSPEPSETFKLQLSDPTGATLGAVPGVGTIADDDAPPKVKAPKSVGINRVFCITQNRGRCRGLQFTAQFLNAPGNATWTFDAYNPNSGGRHAIRYVRVGMLRKAIKTTAPTNVTFKLTGAKAKAALRRIRKGKLTRVRMTTAFTTAATSKTTQAVNTIKLR